jgi:hypothetical protein
MSTGSTLFRGDSDSSSTGGKRVNRLALGRTVALLTIIVAVLVISGGAVAGVLWGLKQAHVFTASVVLPILLVLAVVSLLTSMAVMSAVFQQFELSDESQPLGMPQGSMPAVIALVILLMFAVIALYLYTATPGIDKADLSRQLVTTLSTLAVAVSAFYFGSRAVTSGITASTASSTANAPPSRVRWRT